MKKMNIFYNNFVMPVKLQFDFGIVFLNKCLEEYYKSKQNQTRRFNQHEEEQVRKYKEDLIALEELKVERYLKIKKKMLASKKYQTEMKAYFEKNQEKLKEKKYLLAKHPDYLKKMILYKFDSEIFKNIEYSRSIFNDKKDPSKEEVRQAIFNMVKEKHLFSGKLYQMMIIFIELMKLTYETTTSMLKVEFHTILKDRYFQFIRPMTLEVENYYDLGKEDPAKEHVEDADRLRKTEYFKNIFEFHKLNVENISLLQKPEWSPFFFEETYEKIVEPESLGPLGKTELMNMNRSSIKKTTRLGTLYNSSIMTQKKQHLIILVHGYHASHFDMRVYQNFLAKIIPHSIFLISKANEDMTKKKIPQMGIDLANEIIKYVQETKSKFSKISFIGHSLGGVIIRTALNHLPQFKAYFFSFVSLSSPHLGCQQNKSSLVNIGMTFMEKVQKDQVISQLNMTDHEDPNQTFLYKLAENDQLNLFNNVIMVSSPQDKYVPYTSARIQPVKPQNNDKMDNAIFQMAKHIWDRTNNDMIVRIDVDLRSEKK